MRFFNRTYNKHDFFSELKSPHGVDNCCDLIGMTTSLLKAKDCFLLNYTNGQAIIGKCSVIFGTSARMDPGLNTAVTVDELLEDSNFIDSRQKLMFTKRSALASEAPSKFNMYLWCTSDSGLVNQGKLLLLLSRHQLSDSETILASLVASKVLDGSYCYDASLSNGIYQPLTRRESEILDLISQGKISLDIANELFISERTVKFHISNIFSKLGVNNRAEAVSVVQGGRLGG